MRDDVTFGIVNDASFASKYGVEADNIVMFKNYDDKKTLYQGKPKQKEVEEWIIQNSLPLVGEFTEQRAQRFMKRGLPIAKFFMKIDRSPVNQKHLAYYVNRLKDAATEFKDKIIVTIASSESFGRALQDLGWKDKDNVMVLEDGKKRYRFENTFKADNVKAFFRDFLDNKLTSYIKSEPVPSSNDGPVKVVVGKNFNDIVKDDQDVLIEFYAPWCGHCKSLEPKYNQLGAKFKEVDTVTIAKMDATANDVPTPGYEVQGFPTIFFKPAGKSPIKYESGEREVADFTSFIKKHATHKFSFKKSKN